MSSEKHTQLYRYVSLCRLIYETWKIILPPLIFVVINKQTTTNFEYYNVIGRQIVKKLKDLYSLYHRKKSPGLNCWKTEGNKVLNGICIRCSFNGFASTHTSFACLSLNLWCHYYYLQSELPCPNNFFLYKILMEYDF